MPGAISHVKTRYGLASVWRRMATDVYSARVLQGMPKYVERLASTFWDVDPSQCATAITKGDPAFFVSFLIRLDQIDCALIEAGRTIASRTPVLRAKYIIDGFREAAEQGLVQMGGVWPPADPRVEQESA